MIVAVLRPYKSRRNRKRHCTNGHEFTFENTKWIRGGRYRICKQCHRDQQMAYKKRNQPNGWVGRSHRTEIKERAELARLLDKYGALK